MSNTHQTQSSANDKTFKVELPPYDTLRYMAENDPDALQLLKQTLTAAIIRRSSNEVHANRLRGIQFKIDTIINGSSNPLDAAIKISNLMHESLDELNDLLNGTADAKSNITSDNIIQFSKDKK